MERAGLWGAQCCQRLMINPAPHVPSAILIKVGGRLWPLAPQPPHRDTLVPAAVPLGTSGRASPWWAATIRHRAGVGAAYLLPAFPLLAPPMPQGPVLGLCPSKGGGKMKVASLLPYFPGDPTSTGAVSGGCGAQNGGRGPCNPSTPSPVVVLAQRLSRNAGLPEPVPLHTGFGWVI